MVAVLLVGLLMNIHSECVKNNNSFSFLGTTYVLKVKNNASAHMCGSGTKTL